MQRRRFLLSAAAGLVSASGLRAGPDAPPVLTLARDTLTEDTVFGRFVLPASALPSIDRAAPVINPADPSPEAGLLRRLYAQGKASGLAGTLYDNRDRGHSNLPPALFPQMTRIAYGPGLRARNLDYGLAGAFRFPAITLGNSSTAVTQGVFWRSLPRLAMTTAGDPARAAADYGANALYVYPGHRDHDTVDLYPALWPHMVTSQGSSGSDRPFLRALGMILAAFPPETRARMENLGLVAPTTQWVLRRSQRGLYGDAAYMSGAAHPSVFAAAALNPAAAVSLAASVSAGTIPPGPQLRVLAEDFADRAGLAHATERLFDTPAAIARIWRSLQWRRSMVVSAAETADPAGRPLTFRWVLLRGDPAAVTITLLDAQGSRARIMIDWQVPRPAPTGLGTAGPGPLSSRIDVGVFAEAGGHPGPPAFVSVILPPQLRRYELAADSLPRLVEIDYDAQARGTVYDPLLFWWAPWRDRLHYDPSGKLAGWTREATAPTVTATEAAGDYAAGGARNGHPIRYTLMPPVDGKGPELRVIGEEGGGLHPAAGK